MPISWPGGSAIYASFAPTTTVNLSWSAASSIYPKAYHVDWSTDPNFGTLTGSYQTGWSGATTYSISGLAYGTTYYFRVNAGDTHADTTGWLYTNVYIPTVPSAPYALTLTGTVPSTVSAAFNVPSNGGAALTWFEIHYGPNADFSGATGVSSQSPVITVTDVSPGVVTYFRGRSYNSQGVSGWSPSSNIQLLSGPRVKYGGTYRTTVSYVKYQGVYRVAIPYVKLAGVWRVAGG